MSIGSADLWKSIAAAWQTYELDAPFKVRWDSALLTKFPVLNDSEAEAAHPHPYCVLEVDKPRVNSRSSAASGASGTRHIRDVPVDFTVYARQANGQSAKAIAAALAEEITKIFGGHPTIAAQIDGSSMDYGHVLIFQYDTDYGIRVDIENYSWHVSYNARLDVPVA